MDTTSLPRTKAERDAFFAKMFVGMQPAELKPQSIAATLRPFRRQLVAKRREGYSLRQIAERLKTGPLQIEVAPATLKEIIASPTSKRKAKMKKLAAQRAANLAAGKLSAAAPAAIGQTPVTR